jgi:VWFA-related protein
MRIHLCSLAIAVVAALPAVAQQPAAPASGAPPVVKATAEEVVLDFIVRDKKGKPVTDLKPEDLSVLDNGAKQEFTSFRLVQGAEALSQGGTVTRLDPLRQLRLVTLAFEALGEPDQRKRARAAALDLLNGQQGANVFYSVVEINTRLLVLQQFTSDKDALIKAVEQATAGLSAAHLLADSDRIKSDLRRYLGAQTGDQNNLLTNALDTATQPLPNGAGAGAAAVQAKLASIMLDMLRMDAAMSGMDARLSLTALESLVRGLQSMPGRKSILYFTWGMYRTPELDTMFSNLTGMANRANVTFYSVDTRGVTAGYGVDTTDVSTGRQNAGATDQLNSAASAASGVTATSGVAAPDQRRAVTKDNMRASDNAESAGRANVQLAIRDLAEATGGFLIGESNDLRAPLRRVNEEISSYYELTYNPHIENYDGSFHKLKLETDRKNLVLQARNGYFALPPEARAEGLQAFELPLLKAIAAGQVSHDVEFRAGAVLLRPQDSGTDVSVLVEVPLRALEAKPGADQKTFDVHFSLGSLVKNSKGEVAGPKLTRDRSFHVTAEQLEAGNFVEKMPVVLPPGNYSLETAVLDRESGRIGVERSSFTVDPKNKGVAISSLAAVRSYTPNVKGLDPKEPFQFQGGSITPTLNNRVPQAADSNLRLFFVVYQDPSISAKPTVEIEFLQNGNTLTKVPMPLPDADNQGRIPYVMTIPAAAIPPGVYQVRAIAKQGDTEASTQTSVTIEAK